ncbi:hypothetical protein IP88_04270 [alpha proteobacterium AAP81b]|nr:hypothetical protein IP88_04270 [alpha proteobacterium AAP81b]
MPSRSGINVCYGTAIDWVLTDPVCCSWEGFRAYVTGAAPVTVSAFAWDYNLDQLTPFGTPIVIGPNVDGSGQPPNARVEFGTFTGVDPALLVKVSFRSDLPFTIDDLGYGGTAGIPEPASWALLIAGFGLTGAAARRRRALAAAPQSA